MYFLTWSMLWLVLCTTNNTFVHSLLQNDIKLCFCVFPHIHCMHFFRNIDFCKLQILIFAKTCVSIVFHYLNSSCMKCDIFVALWCST